MLKTLFISLRKHSTDPVFRTLDERRAYSSTQLGCEFDCTKGASPATSLRTLDCSVPDHRLPVLRGRKCDSDSSAAAALSRPSPQSGRPCTWEFEGSCASDSSSTPPPQASDMSDPASRTRPLDRRTSRSRACTVHPLPFALEALLEAPPSLHP